MSKNKKSFWLGVLYSCSLVPLYTAWYIVGHKWLDLFVDPSSGAYYRVESPILLITTLVIGLLLTENQSRWCYFGFVIGLSVFVLMMLIFNYNFFIGSWLGSEYIK